MLYPCRRALTHEMLHAWCMKEERVVDDQDLSGLDPYDLMDEESARLERFFSTLDEPGWRQPTRCAGWSVRDVLAHLASTEEYNRACLDGTVKSFMEAMGARGVTDLASANELGIRDLDPVATPELLASWRTRAKTNRDEFRTRDGGEIDSSVGAYPARWQAFHLAFELATHADDVGVPVTAGEEPARTEWQAKFARFALKEAKPATQTEAGSGTTRVRGDGIDVDVPDAEFVQAAAARLPASSALPEATRAYLSVTP
jgi:uncharacterized protein (TIGR03083 family)